MIKRSKKYRKQSKVISRSTSISDALDQLNQFEKVNFDETVEHFCSLGVDPNKVHKLLEVWLIFHGSGKEIRVIVFTDNVDEAKAGADFDGIG